MTDPTRAYARLIDAFNQNDWPRVRQRAAQLLPVLPHDPVVHFMAGVACMQMQELPLALDHLRGATRLEPGRADFLAQYAKALVLVRRMREARLVADEAMGCSPADPMTLEALGVVYAQVQAFAQAAAVFRRAVALMPGQAAARFHLAHALTALGDSDGAERELEAGIRLEPGYWKAHLTLAQLRRQTPTGNHLERMRSLLAQYGNDIGARIYLNLALAKEYDDTADYLQAFEHLVRGNAAVRSLRPYSAGHDEAMFDALVRTFPTTHDGAAEGDPTHEPIFVIGMPRTGTTLLERILSSHPDVYAAGELQNFPATLQQVAGGRLPLLFDPDLATRMRAIDWRQLGASYLASTRPATAERPRFIDKLPHNFLYAGFIARALPNAKIVCLRRDPLDTCLGNFRHFFDRESPYYDYSYDLLDTGRYYLQFDRLMAHWRKVLPGRILELPYESLVETPEAAARQLLAFCGLPWNDACLHPESNAAPVNTPNAWQVRAPVYRTAVGRWKHYEPQLRALRQLLGEAGIAWRD
ncbi:sulfotransferase [Rhodanobacter sp. FW510-R12]|uniref:tetratricopeptide repeat-containing sulfotransferase family protein n=1 Tax=unclassified Rhodanobacter TaxID=2621553 RepID=UPI0007A9FF7E|nr:MULTISPECIES: sulfotransferase [unclassified Rhodanobacter]KZC15822.1 sulfotransferase [Rhodanobacter sp. FW104-R8]KZC27860.1 sulfotransferase [Rhodanobacter sp. FW510-T8]KZC32047.1 sulfotransferase [Rhodanobacter sp. FW510-R10]